MIKSLFIQNFQSHEKTQLSFHEGVNVIVGSSDSGKTAIIRALRWIIWNRPSGDHIRSTWGGDTSVSVGIANATIVRSKGKQDSYQIRSEDKNLDFRAFGTTVPDEIQKLFNISEINLQGQLDAPFLLSETPGAVAAHFNKVAKLDKIDMATSNINSWIRNLSATITFQVGEEKKLNEKLTKFEHIEKLEADIESLEELDAHLTSLRNGLKKIKEIISTIERLNTEIEEQEAITDAEPLVDKLLDLYSKKKKVIADLTILSGIQNKIVRLKEKQTTLEAQTIALPLVEDILSKYANFNALQADLRALKRLSDATQVQMQRLEKTQEKAVELMLRFEKEMPNICPLCDQPIKKI